jgi:UDP-N-acetylmuramate--alanine ligase
MVTVDLASVQHVHLVGVGGAGMSAYATVLAARGITVSGSDVKHGPAVDRLRAQGIDVAIGHHPDHVAGADLVAVSSAVPPSNPEVAEARRRGIPVASRADLLQALCADRRLLAVAGTHGKTTTTSMAALVLVEAGMRPAFLIGGDVNEIGTNAVWDDGPWMVVEADESDGTFLRLRPEVGVVTNVEADHLDHYGDVAALHQAFTAFALQCNVVVVGADDAVARGLRGRHRTVTVGIDPDADYRVVREPGAAAAPSFTLHRSGELVARIDLVVPGDHNVANAAMAAVAALEAGADLTAASRALARFAGVARRFEHRGEVRGVRIVDDYAHHPTEVAATIEAARQSHDGRIVVVFQPHRYSRTAALAEQFGPALAAADEVVVTDVYPAGEQPVPGVTGRLVADAVDRVRGGGTRYVERPDDLVDTVWTVLRPGDLCLTLGAGDVTALADRLLERS